MKEEYRKIVNELSGLPEDSEINLEGATDTAVTNLMICKRLDRIADVLEDINGTLIRMEGSVELLEKLVDCVDEIPQHGNRFVVGGMVQVEQK